jgi:nucleotide-binding universal stress UspA family protein
VKILLCTDGSEQAERAVKLGAEFAAAFQAEVTLLAVQESSGQSEAALAALRRGQQVLEGHKIPGEAVTKSGDPIVEIVKKTEELKYDLVVIGAVRKGYRGPFAMSSKAYKIVKLIKPPVLVVMGNVPAIRRILVCSGGKGYIESAFDLVSKIAQKTSASVTLFHVMVQTPVIYTEIHWLEEDVDTVLGSKSELGRTLRQEMQSLSALGIKTEVALRQGLVLDEIFKELEQQAYDLVVAGSSLSTGPLRTYVLGDVTREIVNRVDCPVLVARHARRPRNLLEILGELLHGFSFSPTPAANEASKTPKS